MTEKRLFVGRKKCEDRFTIITDYDGEIGVKENRSGDVLVLKHSDLNAQQFVAQLVVFLNDQNQAIVDLYDGSKYWSDKATEMIKELQDENEQLKSKYSEQCTQLDFLKDENQHMRDLVNENKQLKQENKEFKAQLYCDLDEGVCIICKHHYLEKGKTYDKYYISKCKKGHEECSKMDLKYCDDFELREGDI